MDASDVAPEDARSALETLMMQSGVGYAALSRMLRRNDAYLQQYVKRGSPRVLSERDRRQLAAFFRIDESVLGGPRRAEPTTIRRLDLAASAGPGTLSEDDRAAGSLIVDPALLASFGLSAADASFLPATGDSMEPTICDGDLMLVDQRAARLQFKPGIHVIRLDGALMVKRLARGKSGATEVISDNPDYAPRIVAAGSIELIGRVVWLSRALR